MPNLTFTTRGALRKSTMRLANESLALNTIRQNPGISRSDLARITGMSPSSITFIVYRLKRRKIVLENKIENHARVGRRPTGLHLAEKARMAIAVEVSLHGCRAALVDLGGNLVVDRLVPWQPNAEILTQHLQAVIRSFLRQLKRNQVLGVAVGIPGTFDRATGKIIAAENLGWFNVEFGRLLSGKLSLPFYYENSSRLSALAERWFQKAGRQSLQDFVFVAPASGLGTGIVTNGHLLQGASGIAGEFGHIVLYPDGRKCACGNRGCLEQYASDEALSRIYGEETGSGDQAHPDASAIARMARAGDAVALRALQRVSRDLAIGLCDLLWIFNPEAIILGGFYAEAWDLVEAAIREVLLSRAPHYLLAALRICPSTHAADSCLLGAASLVFHHYLTRFDHAGERSAAPPAQMQIIS
jgi:predicted NBD/HSP70 family sugar kinase